MVVSDIAESCIPDQIPVELLSRVVAQALPCRWTVGMQKVSFPDLLSNREVHRTMTWGQTATYRPSDLLFDHPLYYLGSSALSLVPRRR